MACVRCQVHAVRRDTHSKVELVTEQMVMGGQPDGVSELFHSACESLTTLSRTCFVLLTLRDQNGLQAFVGANAGG